MRLSRVGIYLLDRGGPEVAPSIELFRFDTSKLTKIVTFPKGAPLGAGGTSLAVSPDDGWILYVQRDRVGSDLMLVENFR